MSASHLVSGGFFITRAVQRPVGLGDGSLAELLTLSPCLTQFFPDSWAIEWVTCSDAERASAAEELGIDSATLKGLMRSMTEALDRGDLGWPRVWQTSSAANAALSRWLGAETNFAVIELGVPSDVATKLLVDLAPGPQEGESGFFSRLKVGASLEPAGVPMGWEVLGAEHGADFHSWLCNSLQDVAAERLGLGTGGLGLIENEGAARAVVALIESGVRAEPVPWFPGLLCRISEQAAR